MKRRGSATNGRIPASFFGQLNNGAVRYENPPANPNNRLEVASFNHGVDGSCVNGKHLSNLVSGVKLQFAFFGHTSK